MSVISKSKLLITLLIIYLMPIALLSARTVPLAHLSGFIHQENTMTPVEGAEIFINGRATITENNGLYRLDNLMPGQVIIEIKKSGFFDKLETIVLKSGINNYNTQLREQPSHTSFSGTVINRLTGRPVVGVEVRLDTETAVTNQYGKFMFPRVRVGERRLYITSQNFETFAESYQLTLNPENEMILMIPRMQSARVHGVVMTTSHQPVRSATVRIADSLAITDINGKFEIESVLPGASNISCVKEGLRPYNSKVNLVSGDQTLNLVLSSPDDRSSQTMAHAPFEVEPLGTSRYYRQPVEKPENKQVETHPSSSPSSSLSEPSFASPAVEQNSPSPPNLAELIKQRRQQYEEQHMKMAERKDEPMVTIPPTANVKTAAVIPGASSSTDLPVEGSKPVDNSTTASTTAAAAAAPAAAAYLSGRVTDSVTGHRLSGAEIRVNNAVTYTDTEGRFFIKDIPAGMVNFFVKSSGFIVKSELLELISGRNQINISLEPIVTTQAAAGIPAGMVKSELNQFRSRFVTLDFEVVDSVTKSPVENAFVMVGTRSDTTDARGQINFGDLPLGKLDYSVILEDYQPVTGSLNLTSGMNSQRVELVSEAKQNFTLTGLVVSRSTLQPIPFVPVQIGSIPVVTDQTGRFSINDIAANYYNVVVDNPEYEKYEQSLMVTPETPELYLLLSER